MVTCPSLTGLGSQRCNAAALMHVWVVVQASLLAGIRLGSVLCRCMLIDTAVQAMTDLYHLALLQIGTMSAVSAKHAHDTQTDATLDTSYLDNNCRLS